MNYYELLEVSEKSSAEVITGAYKALTKKYHPDVSKDAGADEKMKSINLAYEVLADPKKRAEYDRTLHLNRNTAAGSSDRNRNHTYDANAGTAAQRQEDRRRREYAREQARKQAEEYARKQARKQAEEQARKQAEERYYKQQAERKAAELREKEERKRANRKKAALGMLAALLGFLCFYFAGHAGSGGGSGKLPGMVSSSEKEAAACIEKAKTLIGNRDYHGAMKVIDACRADYPDSKAAAECGSLVSQIEEAVRNLEPQNGTVLERTFQYMGSGILRVTAKSGPVVVKISNKNNPDAYAAMYVRKGQTAELTVTGGRYRVDYKIGKVWFNDTIGFGDIYEAGCFEDDFVFKTETVGTWTSSSVREITI